MGFFCRDFLLIFFLICHNHSLKATLREELCHSQWWFPHLCSIRNHSHSFLRVKLRREVSKNRNHSYNYLFPYRHNFGLRKSSFVPPKRFLMYDFYCAIKHNTLTMYSKIRKMLQSQKLNSFKRDKTVKVILNLKLKQ